MEKKAIKAGNKTYHIDPMEWAMLERWRTMQERLFLERAQQILRP